MQNDFHSQWGWRLFLSTRANIRFLHSNQKYPLFFFTSLKKKKSERFWGVFDVLSVLSSKPCDPSSARSYYFLLPRLHHQLTLQAIFQIPLRLNLSFCRVSHPVPVVASDSSGSHTLGFPACAAAQLQICSELQESGINWRLTRWRGNVLLSVSFLLIEDRFFPLQSSIHMNSTSAVKWRRTLLPDSLIISLHREKKTFFLLFEGVSGKSMRRLVRPSNANRLQTHLPALLCGSWHFFLSGCLIFMVAAMFDLGLRLVCEWRFINVRLVSVLQRSPTHWAVWESISSGRVTAIRTTKVGWRDMRRQRGKKIPKQKEASVLLQRRNGVFSSEKLSGSFKGPHSSQIKTTLF